MCRDIVENLFLIRTTSNSKSARVVECNDELELYACLIAIQQYESVNIISVNRIEYSADGIRTPKIAIESNPKYKKMRKQILGF